MDKAFRVHMLNDNGKNLAQQIAADFDHLLAELSVICPPGREMSIVVTKLEEACFFAKKAMASEEKNVNGDTPVPRTEFPVTPGAPFVPPEVPFIPLTPGSPANTLGVDKPITPIPPPVEKDAFGRPLIPRLNSHARKGPFVK